MPETEAFNGEDFFLGKSAIIPKGGFESVEVVFPPGSLPEGPLHSAQIIGMYSTGRSQIAQIGGDLRTATNQDVAKAIKDRNLEGANVDYFSTEVRIDSYFTDLALDKGLAIGRFYKPGRDIVGEELMALISDRKIDIEAGQAWEYYYEPDDKDRNPEYMQKAEDIKGVVVRIAGSKLWIPPQKNLLRARDLSSNGKKYRDEINKLLVTAPESEQPSLWIGETSTVIGMDEGIDAVLDREVYSSITTRGKKGLRGKHINARLLDGGKVWHIRVEVIGPTTNNGDNYIILRFKEGVTKTKTSQSA